jgi:hypothetical protein
MAIWDQGAAHPLAIAAREKAAAEAARLKGELGTDTNIEIHRLQERLRILDDVITNGYVAADGLRMSPDDVRLLQNDLVHRLAHLRGQS